ncbi:hypothetical protein B0F90DRAFT_1739462 [Multifurca ochricompacta]|uniref:Uncharacterized protein n=1 Tax=Multifurca ochricompacta TaxID=376703 RepID=A0AAD4QLV1_9AGAM|nr:hypothetical protein B0F90DRAFT_1739462 [Multifurca ochricompacta]
MIFGCSMISYHWVTFTTVQVLHHETGNTVLNLATCFNPTPCSILCHIRLLTIQPFSFKS